MSNKKKYEIDMCSGSVPKAMLSFTLPLMLSSILQLLFNAADIVVVGRFAGDNSLAAVGSNSALINLMTGFFMGLSVGANVYAARCCGAGQIREAKEITGTSLITAVFSGLLMTLIGVFGSSAILRAMSTPEEVLPLAIIYMRIYFCGMIPNMLYNFGSALLRSIGDTKRPLYYLFISGVLNVILNLIFVIVLRMDVAGVGLATVISQTLSAYLVVRCLFKNGGAVQIERSELKFSLPRFMTIIKIGLPAGVQGVIFSLSNIVIQSSINSFGNIVVAGSSAAQNIEGFVYISMNAFYQSALSFTSQNVGAGNYKRINKILVWGLAFVTLVGMVMGNGAYIFGRQLLGIYTQNPLVIEAGVVRMQSICTIYALCGIMEVFVASLRGMGSSVVPTVTSVIGAFVVRMIWLATVFRLPEYHTAQTVYYSYPVSWIITITAHLVCWFIVRRRFKNDLISS